MLTEKRLLRPHKVAWGMKASSRDVGKDKAGGEGEHDPLALAHCTRLYIERVVISNTTCRGCWVPIVAHLVG